MFCDVCQGVFTSILHVTSSLYSNSTVPVPVHRLKGQSVILKSKVPNGEVRSPEWSCNNSVIAFLEDQSSHTLLQSMVLDNDSFHVTISPLMPKDTGLYTFTVDNQLQTSYYLQIKGR